MLNCLFLNQSPLLKFIKRAEADHPDLGYLFSAMGIRLLDIDSGYSGSNLNYLRTSYQKLFSLTKGGILFQSPGCKSCLYGCWLYYRPETCYIKLQRWCSCMGFTCTE